MLKLSVALLLPCLLLFSQCKVSRDSLSPIPPVAGEWYGPGDSISFFWGSGNGRERGNRITCSLEQDGRRLYSEDFAVNEMITIPIPIETGSGILRVICQPQNGEGQRTVSPVYYLEEPPDEISLSYYPPVPMAGSIVEASCTAEHVTGETWIKWYLEDELLGEGNLNEGGERVLFYGPGKKGNYTLTAEFFPARPVSGDEKSPYNESIEVFFNDIADQEGTLNPEQWQSLFYCDGTNIDRGRPFLGKGTEKALRYMAGHNLSPQIVDGDRGYGFTSDSYLKYDGKILQGQGSAFALIHARLVLYPHRDTDREEGTFQIFNSTDGRGDNSYSLFIKEGCLLFSLGRHDEFVRSHIDFPPSLDGVPFQLNLVLEQRGEDLLIRWYLDAILKKEDRLKSYLLPQVFSGGGSTLWGRVNYPSFEGILLEWGFNGEPEEVKKFEQDMNHDSR